MLKFPQEIIKNKFCQKYLTYKDSNIYAEVASLCNKNMNRVVLQCREKFLAKVGSVIQTQACLLLPPSFAIIHNYFLTYIMKEEQALAFYKDVKFVIRTFLVAHSLTFPCPSDHYHRFSLHLVMTL
jgi:hypothetical protein